MDRSRQQAVPLTSVAALSCGVLTRGPDPLLGADLAPSPRLRLIRGTLQACSERGYAAVTVGDVVAAVRVSRQTFYEHFESKEACFLAALRVSYDVALAVVAQAAGGTDWRADLRACLDAYLRMVAAEPAMAQAAIVEGHAAGPGAVGIRTNAFDRFAALFEALQSTGRGQGLALAPLDRTLSLALVGAINELALAHLRAGRVPELPGILDAAVALCESVALNAPGLLLAAAGDGVTASR